MTKVVGKELLTRADVCEVLGIGPTKLWTLTASGELPVVRIGRVVRVSRQDLDDFIRRHRSGADEELTRGAKP
jgi:excisionase family DNA binding protein